MPRILAIDWDRHEARALVLRRGPTGLSVDKAVAVVLPETSGNRLPGDTLEGRLGPALAGAKLSGATAILAVGRDDVQFKQLSVPPAPLEELPDLVRFQAVREFTTLSDETPLDYLVVSGGQETAYQVLAAATTTDGIREVETICRTLDVEASRVTMRVCASASLARRAAESAGRGVVLFVHPLTAEADLSVLVEGKIQLLRSVRIPTVDETRFETSDHRIFVQRGEGDREEARPDSPRRQVLVGEIRRTLASASNQLGDRKIEAILIASSLSEDREFADLVHRQTGLETQLCDPWQFVPGGLPAGLVTKETSGRWAAVIGMALDEASGLAPAIDFLHVHRKPAGRTFQRAHALGIAAAVAAMLAMVLFGWNRYAAPRRAAEQLAEELQLLQPQIEQYAAIQADAAAIDQWLATDVNWLDELETLSRRIRPEPLDAKSFPEADDVFITQLTFLPPRGGEGAGRVDLHAASRSASTVAIVEGRLSDERHRVIDRGGAQRDVTPKYGWEFQSEIEVDRDFAEEDAP